MTFGVRPSPRVSFAMEQLDHHLFIHGGMCNGKALSDFFMLNMKTNEWTQILNSGISEGLANHTLTRISFSQLFLLGGEINSKMSNRVMMFDVEGFSWKEEARLSDKYGGGKTGGGGSGGGKSGEGGGSGGGGEGSGGSGRGGGGGGGGGLACHQAFPSMDEDKLSVIYMGGYSNDDWKKHPDYVCVYEFPSKL